jgi:hypothetical protein
MENATREPGRVVAFTYSNILGLWHVHTPVYLAQKRDRRLRVLGVAPAMTGITNNAAVNTCAATQGNEGADEPLSDRHVQTSLLWNVRVLNIPSRSSGCRRYHTQTLTQRLKLTQPNGVLAVDLEWQALLRHILEHNMQPRIEQAD